jgi:enoyl-CoA hydratase/carnithine racemase
LGISGNDDRTSTEGRSAMGRDFTRFEFDLAYDGVATVTMTRPPVNAVDLAMYREIWSLFVDIDQIGKGVRAVVLTGAGKHFCAGNDLDDFGQRQRSRTDVPRS